VSQWKKQLLEEPVSFSQGQKGFQGKDERQPKEGELFQQIGNASRWNGCGLKKVKAA